AGRLDEGAFRGLVRRLVGAGVRTVTPNGNTSEFYALSEGERRAEAEWAVEEAGPEARVVVGVGGAVSGAVAAAEHAREAGAGMVMVHQPVSPYVSGEGWVAYHRAVAEAVPELGVVPYVRSGLVGGRELARLGQACPNVIGVKYAVADPVRFASVAREAGRERFVWVAGLAELYAPAYFACGATGFTSGLVNVAPEVSLAMLRALRAGDYQAAMGVWDRIRVFEELRAKEQSAFNVSVVKEALAVLGLCRRQVRPPSSELPEEDRQLVTKIVKEWNPA
ncbi:dihydrodipicolinate synthase family protein, partial [Streptomyces sp. 7-21]|uniref:dihydrodipicolinate synthase family protein n=1 Tax=Streptomyces sp. 7-21 TaxID=2802283 RepID=UPI00191F8A11